MKRALCLLLVAALAGCADGGDEETTATCLENEFVDAAGACQPHVEPTILLSGLPEAVQQYTAVSFNWTLDNGTRGTDAPVHSMDSRILVSASNDPVGNTTGPDSWGKEVAKELHKNFPDSFTATFRWDEVGTLYLKGYMLINAKNVWVDLGTIEVTQVLASGRSTTITISSPPPSLQGGDPSITVGDAIVFQNDDPATSYTISFDCDMPDVQVGAGSSTDTIVFLVPGQCAYTVNSPLAAAADPLEMKGKIQVTKP